MSAFSDYLENTIVNLVLRGVAYTSPGTTYIALFTSDPTDAASGTEASYTNYARQDVTTTQWTNPADGVTSNNVQIDFPSNGSGSATTITHVGVFDAVTSGNLLFHASLTTSKTLQPGDVISFAAGALQITLA